MSITFCTPGDMFANIPGILGFYPHKSAVFAGFERLGATNQYQLGPILRADVGSKEGLVEAFDTLDTLGVDLALGYVIDEGVFGAEISGGSCDYMSDISTLAAEFDVPLMAVWAAKALYTGEQYIRISGLSVAESTELTSAGSAWDRGVISCVAQAASTRNMVEKGLLPELSRTDMMKLFEPISVFDNEAEADYAHRHVGDMARYLVELAEGATPQSAATFAAALDELWDILALVKSAQASGTAIADDTELLMHGAVFFADKLLRDIALVAADAAIDDRIAPGTHRAYMELALTVARAFKGPLRANALCAYALAACSSGLRVRAIPAVRCAIDADDEHTLAVLLFQGFCAGLFEPLVGACLEGSAQLRAHYTRSQIVG